MGKLGKRSARDHTLPQCPPAPLQFIWGPRLPRHDQTVPKGAGRRGRAATAAAGSGRPGCRRRSSGSSGAAGGGGAVASRRRRRRQRQAAHGERALFCCMPAGVGNSCAPQTAHRPAPCPPPCPPLQEAVSSSSVPPPAASSSSSAGSSRRTSSQEEAAAAASQQQQLQQQREQGEVIPLQREGVQVAALRSMSDTRIAKFNRLLEAQVRAGELQGSCRREVGGGKRVGNSACWLGHDLLLLPPVLPPPVLPPPTCCQSSPCESRQVVVMEALSAACLPADAATDPTACCCLLLPAAAAAAAVRAGGGHRGAARAGLERHPPRPAPHLLAPAAGLPAAQSGAARADPGPQAPRVS